jgi:hypothetical protein
MAQLNALRTAIPRQLEISREFQAQDLSESELKEMRERVLGVDLEVDLRNIIGKSIEQLSFAEVTWERFQQFVQRISEPADRTAADLGAPLEKTQLTTQLRLSAK